MTRLRAPFQAFALIAILGACGPTPPAAREPQAATPTDVSPAGRRADVPDDCAERPGEPAPAPLRTQYTGVAKAARCDREVYTIMGGITHFLGVQCRHCHLEPDYVADTHNKQVANWMARELVPNLQRRQRSKPGAQSKPGGPEPSAEGVWCNDCHAGKARFLGSPRRREFAIDWMTTHLTEELDARGGKPLRCKACHGGDVGSPDFRAKLQLTDLPGFAPAAPPPAPAPLAPPAPSTSPAPEGEPAEPVPDFGPR